MTRDHRDLVAADLRWTLDPLPAAVVIEDEDLIVALIAEADAYRRLSQAAVHALHDLRRDYLRLRATHHHLLDEYRRSREQVAA